MTSAEQALQQVVADRKRISETTDEIGRQIHARVASTKRAIDPRTHIREHPLIALGVVFGVGIAVAMSGADRAAARATADAAKDLASSLHDGAGEVKDTITRHLHADEPNPLVYADGGAEEPVHLPRSMGGRLVGAVDDVVYRALRPVLQDMARSVSNDESSTRA